MIALSICLRCRFRRRDCSGPCPCTVDGVDIQRHAVAGYCPHPAGPRFGDGRRPEGWPAAGEADPIAAYMARPTYSVPEGYNPADYALDSGGTEGCNCGGD